MTKPASFNHSKSDMLLLKSDTLKKTPTQKMKERKIKKTIGRDKDNIKDKHKHGKAQTRETKLSVQHQPYGQAIQNASFKSAFSFRACIYSSINLLRQSGC